MATLQQQGTCAVSLHPVSHLQELGYLLDARVEIYCIIVQMLNSLCCSYLNKVSQLYDKYFCSPTVKSLFFPLHTHLIFHIPYVLVHYLNRTQWTTLHMSVYIVNALNKLQILSCTYRVKCHDLETVSC